MNRSEFLKYKDLPCRFKLRGGKEVFGVIWENNYGNEVKLFFSTAAERSKTSSPVSADEISKMPVALEDIVQAEPLC